MEQSEQNEQQRRDEEVKKLLAENERQYRESLEKMKTDHMRQFFDEDNNLICNFLRRGSKEWNRAWKALQTEMGDTELGMQDPETGESWQYMGTYRRVARKLWWHEFRHRHHPREQKRVYKRVYAGPTWEPMDEEVRRTSPEMRKLMRQERRRKEARKKRKEAQSAAAAGSIADIPF